MEICEANVRVAVLEIRHRWLSRISANIVNRKITPQSNQIEQFSAAD
jgi:hypothetical protein